MKNRTMNVRELGQVFTPKYVVSNMIGLIKNDGRILEPSCGDGAFSDELPNCTAIEVDPTKCPQYALNMDFFDFNIHEKFDTIIGNPPYVRYKDIPENTKNKLDMSIFDERTNLYLFFIHKCINHLKDGGELIFITPRDFLKATSSIKLNQFIYENGTITDIIDLGDKIIFPNYAPNCIIFRFEKGNYSRITNVIKEFKELNGQLLFVSNEYNIKFKDLFYVKVGGVSGADNIFENDNGNLEFVCSKTRVNNKTRKMFYNTYAPELEQYKEKLLERKIKRFNENNWYNWGRNFYQSEDERIYVNCKTRIKNPFFIHNCKNFDGSVLAIFPRFDMDLKLAAKLLNETDWNELGFVCDGRYLFSQKSLENCVLPESFKKLF